MTPRYGPCEVGKRLIGHAPFGHGKTTTFVAALRHDGLTAPCVFDGAINGEKFAASIEQELVATLNPGDIVVMDMCGRPQRCKKNLLEKQSKERGRVLTCVRPLLRLVTCRRPVWEFAERGPIQPRALKAPIHDLVFPIPSLDHCAILSV
jgi:hypothetical protein